MEALASCRLVLRLPAFKVSGLSKIHPHTFKGHPKLVAAYVLELQSIDECKEGKHSSNLGLRAHAILVQIQRRETPKIFAIYPRVHSTLLLPKPIDE